MFGKLLLALCVLSFCAWSAGEEKAAPAEQAELKTLTLVTYNVFEHPVEEEKRAPALLRLLKDSKADLLALQEAQPWFMARLQKEEWIKEYKIAQPKTKSGEPCELCLLSKIPLEKVEYLELPGRLGRGALIVRCKSGSRSMALATVHLESFLEDGPVRAKQLEAVFPKLKDADDAVLLGDFNFGDGEKEAESLDKGFTDLWTALHPKEPGYTWDKEASPMARQGSFPDEKSRRLDRILVRSEHWKAKELSLLGDRPVSEKEKDLFPSDHFGLMARLEFQPPPPPEHKPPTK
ncbi:MAG: endonuclease/exonuclease/phosphatase family protein [Planctomycetes bacterium]|nr:endonuclease/exonuclease/phosphatase family protein [Planctomycetota bacterium]